MVKKGIKEKEIEVVKTVTEKQEDKTKKTTTKSKDMLSKRKVFIQFWGKEVEETALLEQFKGQWKKEHNLSEVKDLRVYLKVEEETAYFVVNGEETIAVSFNQLNSCNC